ncbi:MAG: hypothetical protein U9R42_05620 [Bacteroidota bacterium]|nr:hypothetical protein [Bacteroidota bacterium]
MEEKMIKNVFAILVVALVLFACGNKETKDEITKIDVNEFVENAVNYVDQTVSIEGTVIHTCEHGGKKMFISDDESRKVKITAGEDVPKFEQTLEGSDVIIEGVVRELRIDEKYLVEWEMKIQEEEAKEKEEIEADTTKSEEVTEEMEANSAHHAEDEFEHEAEHMDKESHEQHNAYKQIEDLRKQIAETEEGYISYFSIECLKFEEKAVEEENK